MTDANRAVGSSHLVRTRPRYMHTLNGEPGTFDGEIVCYAGGRCVAITVATLREIRKQQRATCEWFAANPHLTTGLLGYVRVS